MEKLKTTGKSEGLNSVYRGEDGVCHFYVVTRADDPDAYVHTITFQKGPRKDEDAQHGVTDTDLLEIVLDRMKAIQAGPGATKECACAITYIEGALSWLNKHTEGRIRKRTLEAMED